MSSIKSGIEHTEMPSRSKDKLALFDEFTAKVFTKLFGVVQAARSMLSKDQKTGGEFSTELLVVHTHSRDYFLQKTSLNKDKFQIPTLHLYKTCLGRKLDPPTSLISWTPTSWHSEIFTLLCFRK